MSTMSTIDKQPGLGSKTVDPDGVTRGAALAAGAQRFRPEAVLGGHAIEQPQVHAAVDAVAGQRLEWDLSVTLGHNVGAIAPGHRPRRLLNHRLLDTRPAPAAATAPVPVAHGLLHNPTGYVDGLTAYRNGDLDEWITVGGGYMPPTGFP
ncbi:hypothetical protein [Candidatus Poriferisodalis sp.]|uniref:hypothetical protein n=1 Tax=Candidatus Poriferisodalis sp. TaxID=3101277 RepID=UPI003B01A9C3